MPCVFCERKFSLVATNIYAIAFEDQYPVVKNHTLVIPKRHVESFFDFSEKEIDSCMRLVKAVRDLLIHSDPSITGFNVGFNDGRDAGQTIFHGHIHIIPRRKNDNNEVRGGIRNIIKNRLSNY